MKIVLIRWGFCLLLLTGPVSSGWALSMGPLPEFAAHDRVLILAPHPDDEAIGTGGVIQKALAAGARVKVVLLTNGENNELSFIVYKKRPVLRSRALLAMGDLRREETLAGVSLLGLTSQDVIALGYPDFGTMDILKYHWGDSVPFRSMLSRVRSVPYEYALSPGAQFTGDNVLRDIKSVLYGFKPTRIFVSHPADTNRDHRALYLFLKVALWDISSDLMPPEIYPYLIHVSGWPLPRGYRPDLAMAVPAGLESSSVKWFYTALSDEELQKKFTVIKQYISQNKYAPSYLLTFARRNELFGDYPSVILSRQSGSDLHWEYTGTRDEILSPVRPAQPEDIAGMGLALRGNDLLVKVGLARNAGADTGFTLYLMGYSPSTDFAVMPKVSIDIENGVLSLRNGRKRLSAKDVLFVPGEKEFFFQIPLAVLGWPQRILASAKSTKYNLTLDETAWRVIELKD